MLCRKETNRARRCPLSAETTFDDTAGPATHHTPHSLHTALLRIAPAVGLFAAARLTGLLLMSAWAWHIGRRPRAILGRAWDADWYMLIAEHGYGRVLTWPGAVQNDLAFFPLYPGLVRGLSYAVPDRITSGSVGLLVSWSAALVAAAGIYAVGERLHGRRTATVLVLLWGLLPHSVVLTMAYTEPLLTAFAAWSLYALLTRRWLWAAVLAVLAGLSRPNGIAVAAAVLCVVAYELVRGGRGDPRLWAAAALAPTGWCGYVLWVGFRTGDPLGGYFAVQRGWTSTFDFGAGAARVVRDIALRPVALPLTMALLIVLVSVVLFALLVLARPPAALLVYTGVLVLITIGGSGFFESKPRFLLPAFPLLLPVAVALTKARPRAAIAVIAALAGLSFGYGTYLLTLSPMAL
ncbi:mannosyltransferase family protein [Streptomyces qinzhouensis]|uniref:mannosyltransferase family protein n=1 Tax=Streptomyces qinzhouensis TaxID=2599401 RepID=UPI001648F4C1|nr:mannosyltransferase family protein [Streptomyces qinzhouensis]